MRNGQQSSLKSRRSFLRNSTIAGSTAFAGLNVLRNGYGANYDKVRVGLVGAGYRGRGALVNVLSLNTNVEIVALADISQESLDVCMEAVKEHRTRNGRLKGFNVTPDRAYVGLDAYKKGVIVIPYALVLPYLLTLFNLHLQYAGSLDVENLQHYIMDIKRHLEAMEAVLENNIVRAGKMISNAANEYRQAMGSIRITAYPTATICG